MTKNIPAFPRSIYSLNGAIDNQSMSTGYGMDLRDYFAAKAMTVVMPAVINELKKTRGSVKEAIKLKDLSAETCYTLADAMMKAREV